MAILQMTDDLYAHFCRQQMIFIAISQMTVDFLWPFWHMILQTTGDFLCRQQMIFYADDR
jgi:hypothetical protein